MEETMEETYVIDHICPKTFWSKIRPAAKTGLAVLGAGVLVAAVATRLNQNTDDE